MQKRQGGNKPGFWSRYLEAVKAIFRGESLPGEIAPRPRSLGISNCHRYRLHGLSVESTIPLPNLDLAPVQAVSDATIEIGTVPRDLADCVDRGARFQASPSGLLIWMDHVARYSVANGNQITVEPLADSTNGEVGELLLSIPIAALLLQRGTIILHASAVATPQGAILIVGRSVAGKSALATWLAQQRIPFMSDDICTVVFDSKGTPCVNPGPARIRLLPEVADMILSRQMPRPGANGILRKISVELEGLHCQEPMPLKKIYLLEIGNLTSGGLNQVTEIAERAKILTQYTYGRQFLRPMNLEAVYGNKLKKLAEKVQIAQYMRPKGANTLPNLGALILKDIGK